MYILGNRLSWLQNLQCSYEQQAGSRAQCTIFDHVSVHSHECAQLVRAVVHVILLAI